MKTVKIIYGALLTAIKILLTRFFSIQLPIMRFSFAFIATMMIGMLFNPWVSGAIAAVTDIIGFAIAPKGEYFYGYTLSAFLSGFVYSFFFYKKEITFKNVILATVINVVFLNMGLNTLWASITTGKAFFAVVGPRLVKNLIDIPLRIVLFMYLIKLLSKSGEFRKVFREEKSIA